MDLIRLCCFAATFVVGAALGAIYGVHISLQTVTKCRANMEWCAVQEPSLYKALTDPIPQSIAE